MSDFSDASDETDELLLGLVRSAIEAAEPGPADDLVDAVVTAAFRLRPDVGGFTLATLVADSLEASGVRDGGDADRVVTFAADDMTVEVHFLSGSDTVVGQVVPAGVRSATVETPDGATRVDVDDLGRFACPCVSSFVRVRLELPDGTGVVTRWIVR